MTKKLILYVLLVIISIGFVNALPQMCSSPIVPEMNCTFMTPAISCGNASYNIKNINGTVIKNDSLIILGGNIYYFVFNQSQGDYLITLCDFTTREVNVGESDNNMLGSLIILPIILGIIFLIIGFSLSEDHNVLKLLFYFLSIITFIVSAHIAILIIAKFYAWTEMIEYMSTTVWWIGLIIFFLFAYFILYLLYKWFIGLQKNKIDRIEY